MCLPSHCVRLQTQTCRTVANVATLAKFWCDYCELLAAADKASFPLEWGSRRRPRQEGEMNGVMHFDTQMKKCHGTKRQTAEDLNSTGQKLSQTEVCLDCRRG